MSNTLQFNIILPSKAIPAMEVARVVVPAVKGMLTIVPNRAPTTVLLTNGVLEILNEREEAVKKYFIQGGIANIATNNCVVLTDRAFDFDEISKEMIEELRAEHYRELSEVKSSFPINELEAEDSEMKFYDYITHYMSLQ